ncbi:hypothetical protein PGT21_026747 [Puccinia graminis f. sp. tritici]|uniref:Uncharacterized protein n=1 Tax=Puccinia graminis f. sp. tritici TaxID=56615 RepID=A0A5B0N6M6_PUCGR|nr:hypothetical protein PGT21_026747 [Puccinia graminis f. sp. tritici]
MWAKMGQKAPPSPTKLPWATPEAFHRLTQKEASENQKLSAFGISGTSDIDPREVPQLCAIWCAQSARPFSALGEQAHRGIFTPGCRQEPTGFEGDNDNEMTMKKLMTMLP